MKFKKFFVLVISAIMLCSAIVSVGAVRQTHDIKDENRNIKAATAIYTLTYYAGMNCVKATNGINYIESVVDVSQRNLPGYIELTVTMNEANWTGRKADYLHTTDNHYEFYSDYYIPSGYVLTSASAYYSTNDMNIVCDGKTYYVNYNYGWAETSTNLVVVP